MDEFDPYAPGSVPESAPRSTWLGRNWMWVIPLAGLTVVGCCGLGCVGLFGSVFLGMKASTPYQQALRTVQEDPQVRELLGEPIEEASLVPQGNIQVSSDTGEAELHFSVRGPRGKARVRAEAVRQAGEWRFTRLDVAPIIDPTQVIHLVPTDEPAAAENEP